MLGRLSGALLAALVLALALTAVAQAKNEPRFSETSILVKFRAPDAVRQTVARLGDRVLGTTLLGVTLVGIDRKESVHRKVAQYRNLPVVAYAEPNFIGRASLSAPNDPSYGSQWGLSTIQALAGWSVTPGSYSAFPTWLTRPAIAGCREVTAAKVPIETMIRAYSTSV